METSKRGAADEQEVVWVNEKMEDPGENRGHRLCLEEEDDPVVGCDCVCLADL